MLNNNLPPVPLVPGLHDDRADSAEVEVDDGVALDPDADPDRIDSAEADRLASGARNDDRLLGGEDPVELP